MRLNTPRFNDFWWDIASPADRNKASLEQAIQTVLFAKEKTAFYKAHYARLSPQDIQAIQSMDEFVHVIPYITKEHVSSNDFRVFIPEIDKETDQHWGKLFPLGTGGSTGEPVKIFHSQTDWRGFALTANRLIEFDFYEDQSIASRFPNFHRGKYDFEGIESRSTPLKGKVIFGAYNHHHITNTIYRTMFVRLGCELFGRPSVDPSLEHIYSALQMEKVNGILAPPAGANELKGIFLDSILKMDARNQDKDRWSLNNGYNPDFHFIFWSSMPIETDLLRYIQEDLQVPYIKGHYGSTELCPTGATCSEHMRNFHLAYGHSLVLLKDFDKDQLVNEGEMGYTLVSKIGASDKAGNNVLPSGMILINYMTGDAARLMKDGETCKCGRNTPVLYDFSRVEFTQGKAEHGCQVD